jgi:hypothetical protein
MSRIFLDTLRANIATVFPDNTLGEISPADLRGICLDTVDSTVPDEALLTMSAPLVGEVLTATPSIPLSQFDGSIGGDGVFLKPNPAGGYIEGTTTAGFSYYIIAESTFSPGNNEIVNIQGVVDGVPFGPVQSVTGNGTDAVSVSLIAVFNSMPSDGQLALSYAAPDGAATITIQSAETLVIITPTNNP